MSKKITFSLAPEIAADATEGILLGDFNNWLHEAGIKLKKQKDGSLKATVALEPGTYQYRYFLNDGRWVNDGNAVGYNFVGEFGVDNCVISVPAEEVKETVAKGELVADIVVTPKAAAKKETAPKAPAKKIAATKAVVAPKTAVAPKAAAPKAAAPKAVAPKAAAPKAAAPKAAAKKPAVKETAPAKKTVKKSK